MTRGVKIQLPFCDWPQHDRRRWSAANKSGVDIFDDCGPAAHLAEPSRRALQGSYSRFLGFVAAKNPRLLDRLPDKRLDRKIIADYVAFRQPSCSNTGIAIDLHHLRLALRYICPAVEWAWLATITKRIAANAKRTPQKHHLVTSERLYKLGIELMDQAVASAMASGKVSKIDAFQFRDGLLIAFLALIPLRRRTVAAVRIGKQLLKAGGLWVLDIPAQDVKAKRMLDYLMSSDISRRIDLYLETYRRRIPRAKTHNGLWASNQGRPMDHGTIYDTVCRRTFVAFGFKVNLHRFRSAAATLWAIHDPANVKGVKDLLGHVSFDPTEKYYIIKQSRVAGRVLASAWALKRNMQPRAADS
jgi:integrase/recombinase XerD